MKTPLPAEAELLLCCMRKRPSPVLNARVSQLLSGQLDWPYLLRMTQRYSARQFLIHGLLPQHANAIPLGPLDFLRQHAEVFQIQFPRMIAEWRIVQIALEENKIPIIAFRNASLMATVYSDSRLRELDCLDFLIDPSFLTIAGTILQKLGYKEIPIHALGPLRHRTESFVQYVKFDPFNRVELHWKVAAAPSSFRIESAEFRSRLRQTESSTVMCPCLDLQDLLLALCIRETVSLWDDLSRVLDIAEVLQSSNEFFAQKVLEAAGRFRCMRALLVGAALARDLFATQLSAGLSAHIDPDKNLHRLTESIQDRFFRESFSRPGGIEEFRFQWRVRDRFLDRAAFALRYFFIPSVGDTTYLPLPERLSFLYALLRPMRLAFQLGKKISKGHGVEERFEPSRFGNFNPSPNRVIERMLALAEVGPQDVLYDLGCGDGRIVVEAARRCGALAVGVDVNPLRIAEARENARRAGVAEKVEFLCADATKIDVSPASVVTLYISSAAALQLREKLEKELRPGSRIVSHAADIGEWEKCEVVDVTGMPVTIFLGRVGASAKSPGSNSTGEHRM